MVTALNFKLNILSDSNFYIFVPQLFENISAFDLDGEGELSLNQFKWFFLKISFCFQLVTTSVEEVVTTLEEEVVTTLEEEVVTTSEEEVVISL